MTNTKPSFLWYQYGALTCDDGNYKDAMLVPNKRSHDRLTPDKARISVVAWFVNINLVDVLGVSDQKLEIMHCFV